jgi:hypothetical protein
MFESLQRHKQIKLEKMPESLAGHSIDTQNLETMLESLQGHRQVKIKKC